MRLSSNDVREFLAAYPRMYLRPAGPLNESIELQGIFQFSATYEGKRITDEYALTLVVPTSSEKLPKVYETGGRIPRDADHHVYPAGHLCLGSNLRLRTLIGRSSSLLRFSDECLVPYLYAYSAAERQGGELIFGELKHGAPGLVEDYERLFGIESEEKVQGVLQALGLRRRVSNKRPCPCGCGRRLGRCPLHLRLSPFRRLAPRSYFRKLASLTNPE